MKQLKGLPTVGNSAAVDATKKERKGEREIEYDNGKEKERELVSSGQSELFSRRYNNCRFSEIAFTRTATVPAT